MSELGSQVNPNSADYKANYAGNKAMAEQLAERQQVVASDRSTRVIELQRQRGKLLTRERIEASLIPAARFWNYRHWQPGICTRAKPPARAS